MAWEVEKGINYGTGNDIVSPDEAITREQMATMTVRYFKSRNLPYEAERQIAVSYTHLRAHETPDHLVCRLLLEKTNSIPRVFLCLTPRSLFRSGLLEQLPLRPSLNDGSF